MMTRELGIGGCERDLAKLATGLDRSRFEPHVGCFIPGGFRSQEIERAGVPILNLRIRSMRSRAFWGSLRQMAQYLKRHEIQIVHTLDVPANIVATPLGFVRRVPLVISSQLGARDLYDRRTHRLLRVTDRLTDLVVVNSDYQRRQLIENEGVAAGDIAICYNGVDERDFHPAEDPAARRNILPPALRDAERIIGTVAALRPEKDLAMLIEAFARIQNVRPGARLLVVGDGVMLGPWSALAERLGIMGKCHFEPAKPAVSDWMRAIDIYVLCSTSESFSNSLLEAMASGCCPIATRVGGIPEMVEHEKTGLLIESGDVEGLAAQLSRVLQDDSLRESLAASAARHAHTKFSVQAFVSNMQEIYLSRFRKARPHWPC